ncbi:hypothetical protein [Streptacidiphilus sp. EB103A]|uniref:beta barrel domain-containing protein n=1 Tax=Streptacidiphilus sp. EB103A TaxID=3156275 RepID=UPI0035151448
MPKPELGPLAVGDQVTVISNNNAGDRYPASVVKIGRAWVDLAGPGGSWRMRLDTQEDGSRHGHPARFATAEQVAWAQRIADARQVVVTGAKLHPGTDSPWAREDRLLALAAFLAAYDAEHPTR